MNHFGLREREADREAQRVLKIISKGKGKEGGINSQSRDENKYPNNDSCLSSYYGYCIAPFCVSVSYAVAFSDSRLATDDWQTNRYKTSHASTQHRYDITLNHFFSLSQQMLFVSFIIIIIIIFNTFAIK